MQRLYPKIDIKICLECGNNFGHGKLYGKRWDETIYCSHKCFGKADGRRRTGMDETKHSRWKGDKVGYYGVHDWITKHYGQPKKCEVCDLDDPNKKYHWANLDYEYQRNIDTWKRMCVSCHRKYDYRNNKKKN